MNRVKTTGQYWGFAILALGSALLTSLFFWLWSWLWYSLGLWPLGAIAVIMAWLVMIPGIIGCLWLFGSGIVNLVRPVSIE